MGKIKMEAEILEKILHNIKSKSVAIKNAAELFTESNENDRKELAELMKKSAEELTASVEKLKK